MIDLDNEELIRLEDARDFIPSSRKAKKISKCVLHRWANQGVRGVVLETIRIGGGRFTSREAISRFVAAQNQSPAAETPTPQRHRDTDVQNELRDLGI